MSQRFAQLLDSFAVDLKIFAAYTACAAHMNHACWLIKVQLYIIREFKQLGCALCVEVERILLHELGEYRPELLDSSCREPGPKTSAPDAGTP